MVQLELCKRGSIKTSSRGKEEKKEKIVTKKRKTEKKHINPQNEINFYTHKFSFFRSWLGWEKIFGHILRRLFLGRKLCKQNKRQNKNLWKNWRKMKFMLCRVEMMATGEGNRAFYNLWFCLGITRKIFHAEGLSMKSFHLSALTLFRPSDDATDEREMVELFQDNVL